MSNDWSSSGRMPDVLDAHIRNSHFGFVIGFEVLETIDHHHALILHFLQLAAIIITMSCCGLLNKGLKNELIR